jgi:hypothetical protein
MAPNLKLSRLRSKRPFRPRLGLSLARWTFSAGSDIVRSTDQLQKDTSLYLFWVRSGSDQDPAALWSEGVSGDQDQEISAVDQTGRGSESHFLDFPLHHWRKTGTRPGFGALTPKRTKTQCGMTLKPFQPLSELGSQPGSERGSANPELQHLSG